MYSGVVWELVSSETQVQPQIILNPDTFQTIFPFLMTMVQTRKSNMTSYISDILDVLKFHLLCLFFFQISCYDLFFVLDLKHVFIKMFWEGI